MRVADGMSPCEAVRERGIKVLTPEEIEVSRKVCRVSFTSHLGHGYSVHWMGWKPGSLESLPATEESIGPTTNGSSSAEQIANAEQLSREVLDIVASYVRPGITTDELDRICHEECIKRDAYPSPLNYAKFPKSICTSVNEVICHVRHLSL